MSNLDHLPVQTEPFGETLSQLGDKVRQKLARSESYVIVWWFFVASVTASTLPGILGGLSGPLSYFVTIIGTAGCAWGWLFSRMLFRPMASKENWPIFAVFTVMAVESSWEILSGSSSLGLSDEVKRVVGNAASMICITALVMVFVEAFAGVNATMPRPERRFRQIFSLVFGAITATAILWVSNAGAMTTAGQLGNYILAGCAFVCLVGSRAAIWFRQQNPLPTVQTPTLPQAKTKAPRPLAATDHTLAQRIIEAIKNETLLTTPGLKIASFAEAVDEHEYKVTQCITGHLQYRNFNHFINSHRIAFAKRALSDAKNSDRPILSIAFDCGFNSIGPFNRAFKQDAGITPREFRMAKGGEC